MRFERHGGAPDLPVAFSAFMTTRLRGRSLDDNQNQEATEGAFPDFGCFGDLVMIEMKHLEADQHERINGVLDEKIHPAEKPVFYGSRQANLVMNGISNADNVHAAVFSKLSRTIETVLSKANRQFGSYRSRHPRKNAVNICVLLNSRLMEYTPEVVAKAIHSKMKASQAGEPRFPNIDAVLYISEKHFRILPDGRPAHPVTIYEGMGAVLHEWKVQFIDHIVRAWSEFRTGTPMESDEDLAGYETVQDVPDRMSPSDACLLEYERKPYLRDLTVAQLRMYFQRMMAVNSLAFLKGSWAKPSKEETSEGLRRFQHTIAETNRRGVDMRELAFERLTVEELSQVFAGLPPELAAIMDGKRTSPTAS